jgi:hypothetical protein
MAATGQSITDPARPAASNFRDADSSLMASTGGETACILAAPLRYRQVRELKVEKGFRVM